MTPVAWFVLWCIIHTADSGKAEGPWVNVTYHLMIMSFEQNEGSVSQCLIEFKTAGQPGKNTIPVAPAVPDEVAYSSSEFHVRASMRLQRS